MTAPDDIKTRLQLANHAAELGCRTAVEVGVHLGKHAAEMLKRCPSLEKLYCIDPWDGPHYTWLMPNDDRYAECQKRLAPFGDRVELIRTTSMEAVERFEIDSLDWVFIDAQHWYEYVLEDIRAWWPKCRTGGLFAGHDYYKRHGCRVPDAVKDFFTPLGREWHVTTERHASWWLVK